MNNLTYEEYTDRGYLNGIKLPIRQIIEQINTDLAANELAQTAPKGKAVLGLANMVISLVDQVIAADDEAEMVANTDHNRAEAKRDDATAAMLQVVRIVNLVRAMYGEYRVESGQELPRPVITPEDLSPQRTIN